MKRYSLSFADSITHVPEYPYRTAKRSFGWDIVYQVWSNRASMLKSISMQDKGTSSSASKWKECYYDGASSTK